jgi:ATP-dependent RNA helicase DDX46/PRP5
MALENSNKKVPDDLKELHDEYLQKVKDGEIDKKRANIGFIGKGFKFDAEEENKIKELRMELSKEYGFAVDNDKDENDIDLNKEDQEKLE